MFDITSSKLLILAIVALLVVGPKDLPVLLRAIGKYLSVIRRQAAEFRAQFDEAIREAELKELKQEFESAGSEAQAAIEEGSSAIDRDVKMVRLNVDRPLEDVKSDTGAKQQNAQAPNSASNVPKPSRGRL